MEMNHFSTVYFLPPAASLVLPQLFCCNVVTACWFFQRYSLFLVCPPTHKHTQVDRSVLVLPRVIMYTIKEKSHPEVLFHSQIPSICDAQCISAVIFVIKCCNLCVRCTHSLSTCLLHQLMLLCISQNAFNQSPQIRHELVAWSRLCVGGESRSESRQGRFVPIKKKWVTLCSQSAASLFAAKGGEIHTKFTFLHWMSLVWKC